MSIYVTLKDPLRTRKILAQASTSTTLAADDFEDDNLLVREGIAKQWEHCANWGGTLVSGEGTPYPYAFYGAILYTLDGTSMPTHLPSSMPSENPSQSSMPSISLVPSGASISPSISAKPSSQPSDLPSISAIPSLQPSISRAPSRQLVELVTRGDPEGEEPEGSSGDGVMFDTMADSALEVYSITFGQMVRNCVYSRRYISSIRNSSTNSFYCCYSLPRLLIQWIY